MSTENAEEIISPSAGYEVNSEEVQEIITAVPSWILRWGITLIFTIILLIVLASAFIEYPDIIRTDLKVNSLNAPKSVFSKQTGKITKLLAREGRLVKRGAPLAFMESIGNHYDVLRLHEALLEVNNELNTGKVAPKIKVENLSIGELQSAYQNFYQQYLQYISTQEGGYYVNRKKYLEGDLKEIGRLKDQIIAQQSIQEKEFVNIEQEFNAYSKLYKKGVISNSEFKQQENKYLSGKYPLQQSITSLINNNSIYTGKQKEILELEHTIREEKAKFIQSLNNIITETDAWINQFILSAPVDGTINFAGIVQENQTVNMNQELFVINPSNTDFFGEVQIPQYNMGKIKNGQRTLIKMKSYPFEQYGLIRGKINYISEVAFKDSVFIAKISFDRFENKDPNHKIVLKNGMKAEAEIVTEESSLLQRFLRNFTKMLNSNH
jgi:HlyD family secretion protein